MNLLSLRWRWGLPVDATHPRIVRGLAGLSLRVDDRFMCEIHATVVLLESVLTFVWRRDEQIIITIPASVNFVLEEVRHALTING